MPKPIHPLTPANADAWIGTSFVLIEQKYGRPPTKEEVVQLANASAAGADQDGLRAIMATWPAPDPVPTPGPVVQPVSRLHADGWDIVTDNGRRYVSNGVTDFSLLQVLLELDRMPTDADLDAHLDAGYQGFNEHRVFHLFSVIPSQRGRRALTPENYPRFWDTLDWLTNAMRQRGKLIEWTTGDRVPMGLDDAYLKRHFGRLFEILAPGPNLVEGVNEIEHGNNAVDPTRVFTDVPKDIFFCCGSSLSGGPCPHFARDNWSAFHDSRDEKKTFQDANPIEQIIGWSGFAGLRHPIRVNEFPGLQAGADPNANGWKRYSDKRIAGRLAGIVKPWAGGTLHVQHGIFSEPFDDTERDGAAAWQEAMR
jgi:hypothetical protein